MMTKLKYGNELVKEVAKPINDMNAKINELKAERDKLQTQLDKDKNSFEVDTIRKNRVIKSELSLLHEAIQQAENHLTELLATNGDENYKKATELIDAIKEEERQSMAKENEQIAKKLEEIQAIYEQMKKKDAEIKSNLIEFTEAINPYLNPMKKEKHGMNTDANVLKNSTHGNYTNRSGLFFIDIVQPDNYQIKDLIPPKNR